MKNLLLLLSLIIIGCTTTNDKSPVEQNQVKAVEAIKSINPQEIINTLERVKQRLVRPPHVPAHSQVAVGKPKIIEVRMVIAEKAVQVSDDAVIQALTFNGSIPGSLIVVHQDDYVELTLVNPESNSHMHNIDFHAATGALGGGSLTKVKPGQEVKIRFKATKAGVFVYHCAPNGMMIPYHVVSGMNGAIMVLPREGLKDNHGNPVRYDKAYYIGEQDYYKPAGEDGEYKQYQSSMHAMADTLKQMKTLKPSHIVFNGKNGALTGENALIAKTGEKVLFIHSQANRDSRPHLIGGHGDLVWEGGSFSDAPVTNRETWFIPGGSAVAALYEFKQPGTYVYLNHSLIEAIMFGAAAHVKVAGEWDDTLMQQLVKPSASVPAKFNDSSF